MTPERYATRLTEVICVCGKPTGRHFTAKYCWECRFKVETKNRRKYEKARIDKAKETKK